MATITITLRFGSPGRVFAGTLAVRRQTLLVTVAVLAAGWFAAADLTQQSPNSCQTFYYAARALAAGEDPYAAHAPGRGAEYVYPPLLAFAAIPLSTGKLVVLTRLWLVVNVTLTLLALWLSVHWR